MELNPNYAEVYILRGYTFFVQGNQEQAMTDYTKAIELDPEHGGAYYARGRIYSASNDWERAIPDLTRAIELGYNSLDPISWFYNNSFPYTSRGWAYYNQDNYDQAIADFDKAITINPNYAVAYNDLRTCTSSLG